MILTRAISWSVEGTSLGAFELRTVNVFGLVAAKLANLEFTVGCLSVAVTAGQVVHHKTNEGVARNVLHGPLSLRES